MGFNSKNWNNTTLTTSDLNRIEKGIKDSHDTLDLLGEEVSTLQLRQINNQSDLKVLLKDTPTLAKSLKELEELLNKNSNILETIKDIDQLVTKKELDTRLSGWIKITDIKQDGNSIYDGDSIINIKSKPIDTSLDINSNNAISNKAVTKALNNLNLTGNIPTKLAELSQDSLHQTVTASEKSKWNSILETLDNIILTETDPTVPDWAKQKTKPYYDYAEIINTPSIPTKYSDLQADITYLKVAPVTTVNNKQGDIIIYGTDIKLAENNTSNMTDAINGKADTSAIPTALSQLSEDTTHRVVTDTEKDTWNAKSNFDGNYNSLTNKPVIPTNADFTLAGLKEKSYNSLTDKPTIPTNTSQLTNDSGFIDKNVNDLKNYLPLSGGTIKGTSGDTAPFTVQSASTSTYIGFRNSSGSALGYLGVNSDKKPVFYDSTTRELALKSDIPTKTSQLTNDSNFATTSQIPDISSKANLSGGNTFSGTQTFNNGITLANDTAINNASGNNVITTQTGGHTILGDPNGLINIQGSTTRPLYTKKDSGSEKLALYTDTTDKLPLTGGALTGLVTTTSSFNILNNTGTTRLGSICAYNNTHVGIDANSGIALGKNAFNKKWFIIIGNDGSLIFQQ